MSNDPVTDTIPIKVEFSGGLEILFDNKRSRIIDLPARTTRTPDGASTVALNNSDVAQELESGSNTVFQNDNGTPGPPSNISFLIRYLSTNLLVDKRRTDLFEENGTVYVLTIHPYRY